MDTRLIQMVSSVGARCIVPPHSSLKIETPPRTTGAFQFWLYMIFYKTSVRSYCHSGNSHSELSEIHSKNIWIPAFVGMTYYKSSKNNQVYLVQPEFRGDL